MVIIAIAALICAAASAAAQTGGQDGPVPPAKRAKADRGAERGLPRAPRPLPVVIPQQFAPQQEAYASFPETAAAAAAPGPPSACLLALQKLAVFQALPVLVGPGECGAGDAVTMSAIVLPDASKVAVAPPATLRCPMAQEIANWVRDDIAPSLKNEPPLRALDNLDSYSCRGRDNIRAAQLSEHGRADAIDVRDFLLADGRALGLTDVNVDKDWREAIRTSACARFSTVLGPGSDGYHEEHIHLDLAERHNGYKVCEWDVREPPPPPPPVQAEAATPQDEDAAAPGGEPAAVAPIPPDEVPLPRPRPVAQIERALSGRHNIEQ